MRPLFALIVLVAVPVLAASVAEAGLDSILAGPQRSEANRARDVYRHPAQTLAFFGLKPTMTVVEISPSAGWYTEILAPYLRDRGRYIAAGSDPATANGAKAAAKFKAKLDGDPVTYAKVEVGVFAKGAYDIAPPGSADAVLTFRNIHNFYIGGYAPEAFKAFYAALKPGGILGIEEHRLPEARDGAEQDRSGYMKVSTVVRLATDAGFKLVAKSEVNANPNDKADYPDGVWTLPPTYTLGDKDRAKYAAIGESDRMTLKFVKP